LTFEFQLQTVQSDNDNKQTV